VAADDALARSPYSGAKGRLVTLLANDTDPDNDALTLSSVSPTSAAGGTVVAGGRWVFYTPPADFTGADSFTCVVTDDYGLLSTNTVAISVEADTGTAQNIVAVEDLGGGAVSLQFQGIPGRTYTIEYAEDLEARRPFSNFIRRAKKLNAYKPNQGQSEPRKVHQATLSWNNCSLAEKKRRVMFEQDGKCLQCNISEWQSVKLRLEYDHINGDNMNNKRNNVRYLCPNCHSITPTFRNINRDYKGNGKVSDKTLRDALKTEKNIRQALLKVGLAAKAGNYKRAKKLIIK